MLFPSEKTFFAFATLAATLWLIGCGQQESFLSLGGTRDPNLQQDEPTPTPVPEPTWVKRMFTQRYSGRYAQQQDLLVVVDNSGSMAQEIAQVKADLSQFVATLNSRRVVDYQVVVTHTDARFLQGNLVAAANGDTIINSTKSTNPIGQWSEMMTNIVSTPTAGKEMGMRSAELAVKRHGSSFLRPGVPLAVVVISDEDDQSSGPLDVNFPFLSDGALLAPSYYVDWLKGLGRPVSYFPIVGDRSRMCSTVAQYGDRYKEILDGYGGGALGSICAGDLSTAFQDVARVISEKGVCVKLQKQPTGAAVTVSVEGVALVDAPENFILKSETSEICFPSPYLVREGTQVVIDYEGLTLE